jgi:hypothetical protein
MRFRILASDGVGIRNIAPVSHFHRLLDGRKPLIPFQANVGDVALGVGPRVNDFSW